MQGVTFQTTCKKIIKTWKWKAEANDISKKQYVQQNLYLLREMFTPIRIVEKPLNTLNLPSICLNATKFLFISHWPLVNPFSSSYMLRSSPFMLYACYLILLLCGHAYLMLFIHVQAISMKLSPFMSLIVAIWCDNITVVVIWLYNYLLLMCSRLLIFWPLLCLFIIVDYINWASDIFVDYVTIVRTSVHYVIVHICLWMYCWLCLYLYLWKWCYIMLYHMLIILNSAKGRTA